MLKEIGFIAQLRGLGFLLYTVGVVRPIMGHGLGLLTQPMSLGPNLATNQNPILLLPFLGCISLDNEDDDDKESNLVRP